MFACAGRRRLQFQVVGKAATKGWVNLLNTVGDPNGGHHIGFQHLVDPGFATHAAVGRRGGGIGSGHPLGSFAGNGGEHVFHLVKQQRGLGTAFEENLGDLQGAVAVAPAERVAVAVCIFHFKQLQPGGLGHHFRQFGFTRAGWAVQQHVDANFLARHRVGQQIAHHLRVVGDKTKVVQPQRALGRQAGKDRHQLRLVAVGAHQHGWQFFADLHQIGQVSDVVLGDQVFDQANALQAGTRTQCLGHLLGVDAGHFGNGGVGFGCVIDLELHQDAAHVALVAGQRAVQQQRTLCFVKLQQAGQRVDVFLDQCGLALERLA